MTTNPNLSRIRRGATGIFVAATVAVGGLTVELAVQGGTIGHAAKPAGAVPRVSVDVHAADRVSVPTSPAPQPESSRPGEWTPTPPVQNSDSEPHEHTAGS
ncbi:hypothetical protein [Nocardia cerradoensis]|uniref:Uncharacterized protein n=1 Tax=Nocardia cerradoensis TaxID=85688 RepID=A0A231H8F5_9NOCA|nr:hypothetical protein [Nocardia cerradoensis]NKY44715.1 hypothetical protein [Nocardia cerradoensis]OXR45129.1 hypothetical protein B7C42_03086 [Nocardia cerradoensis]